MEPINKEILKTAASKLMLDLSDSQCDKLLVEFSKFQKQLDYISEIPNVDDAEPMVFPFDVVNSYLREDVVEEPLTQEEALKNSSDVENGQVRLPRVVG